MKLHITWGIFGHTPHVEIEIDRDDVEVFHDEISDNATDRQISWGLGIRLKEEVRNEILRRQAEWCRDKEPTAYNNRGALVHLDTSYYRNTSSDETFSNKNFPVKYTGLRTEEQKAAKFEKVMTEAKDFAVQAREELENKLFDQLQEKLKNRAEDCCREYREAHLSLDRISREWLDEELVDDAVAIKAQIEAARAQLRSLRDQLQRKRNAKLLKWLEEHAWTVETEAKEEDDKTPRERVIREELRDELRKKLKENKFFDDGPGSILL